MANIKSQLKRIEQSRKATERNKAKRSALKTLIAKFGKAIEEKDKKLADELFIKTTKALDKAAAQGIIHTNRAAAKKSALSKRLSTVS